MQELSLNEIHEATLNLMDVIDDICKRNGLTYYLAYGTLIGCIRHNGFIPWDDDFDILMPRRDLIEFFRCFYKEKEKYKNCKIVTRKNTTNYYYGIPRFVDTRYHFESTQEQLEKFDLGIFIDLYPLDNFCNSLDEAKRLKKHINKLNLEYTLYSNKKSLRGGIYGALRNPVYHFMHLKYGSNYSQIIDKKIYTYILNHTSNNDRYIGEVCWDDEIKPYERKWFNEREQHTFEDRKYWIPSGYDDFLKCEYGDYMQLPPEEERIPHHFYKIYKQN